MNAEEKIDELLPRVREALLMYSRELMFSMGDDYSEADIAEIATVCCLMHLENESGVEE